MPSRANGVFTTVLVVDRSPHHLGRHLARIAESARIVGLDSPDTEAVRRGVARALTDATGVHRMRIDWDGTRFDISLEAFAGHPATTTVVRAPDLRTPDSPTAGAKSVALGLQGRSLLAWAREQGAGDALLATTDGLLAEGATSNVFYVVEGSLRTPTRATGLLAGVARDLLLEALDVRETDAPYEIFEQASEVFLTSSLRGIQGVTAVDGRVLPTDNPVTRAAQAAWAALPVDD